MNHLKAAFEHLNEGRYVTQEALNRYAEFSKNYMRKYKSKFDRAVKLDRDGTHLINFYDGLEEAFYRSVMMERAVAERKSLDTFLNQLVGFIPESC